MANDSGIFTTTARILFCNRLKQNCGKLQMYCSEFNQWLIHFNTTHGELYCPYSLVQDHQNFLNFQNVLVFCHSRCGVTSGLRILRSERKISLSLSLSLLTLSLSRLLVGCRKASRFWGPSAKFIVIFLQWSENRLYWGFIKALLRLY
jgi:hypothetical protein